MEPQYTVSCSRVNAIGSGTFVLAFTRLTGESEPRGETLAGSSQNQENYFSYENQRGDARRTAQRGAELIRGMGDETPDDG